jgi:hypothetical protein
MSFRHFQERGEVDAQVQGALQCGRGLLLAGDKVERVPHGPEGEAEGLREGLTSMDEGAREGLLEGLDDGLEVPAMRQVAAGSVYWFTALSKPALGSDRPSGQAAAVNPRQTYVVGFQSVYRMLTLAYGPVDAPLHSKDPLVESRQTRITRNVAGGTF